MNKLIKQKYILAQSFLQKSMDEKDPNLSDFYYTQYIETLFKADDDQLRLEKEKQ
jgi:hypothetical protein